MADETVLIAAAQLDPDLRQTVFMACDQAKVRRVFWERTEELKAQPLAPNLLIAALPSGERHIPDPLAQVVTKMFPALPLLVLCNEPVVRNAVTLQNGRITVLGEPLTVEKISGRIRAALSAGPIQSPSGSADAASRADSRQAGSGLRAQEYRTPRWWAASIVRWAAETPPGAQLYLSSTPAKGFAAVLALSGIGGVAHETADLASSKLERAGENLRNGLPVEQISEALGTALKGRVAGLSLNAAANQWSFYCPTSEIAASLISPVRLPNAWDIPDALGRASAPLCCVRASSGDMVVLYSDPGKRLKKGGTRLHGRPGPETQHSAEPSEIHAAAENGGPAVLDFLESRLKDPGSDFAAVIVEVR